MEIKSEYINPSNKGFVFLLKESISILKFSQLVEDSWAFTLINYKGGWDGVERKYIINNSTILIDDIYGGLRIIIIPPYSDKFIQDFKKWIESL